MWDAKYAAAQFEEMAGLKVEKIVEHRSIEWSAEEKENLVVLKVAGKANHAFVLFDNSGIRKWGYILPCSKNGLKDI